MKLPRGVFTFSLDLEMAWGTRRTQLPAITKPYFQRTRNAIKSLLTLFEKYEVSATWAIVGALLLGEGKQKHPYLSENRFAEIPPGDSSTQPFWYGEDIIELILNCKTPQEIACHTLTHPLLSMEATGEEEFRKDLKRFMELFEEKGIERPVTFIYPKAQMIHFDVLSEFGFRCFRGPERKWFEAIPGTLLSAGVRLIDAQLAATPNVKLPVRHPNGLWVIPSSQFYSPFMRVGKYVSVRARVKKAIRGLKMAAAKKAVFHLWTHPWNLGFKTDTLIGGLDHILAESARLRSLNQLDILPMGAITRELDSQKH